MFAEGFIFAKEVNLTLHGVNLTPGNGPLCPNIEVDEKKKNQFPQLMAQNLSLVSKISQSFPSIPSDLPPVDRLIFLDFHGVINCPLPTSSEEIPDAPETIDHFVKLMNFLVELRKKGIGVMILSFVGKMTDSHANLLAFCSISTFQSLFAGVIAVFDRLKKHNQKCIKGKGRILNLFLDAVSYNTIFVDDDPMNLLDASLWIEDAKRCKLIQFADKKLTHKAAMIPRCDCLIARNVKELIDYLDL